MRKLSWLAQRGESRWIGWLRRAANRSIRTVHASSSRSPEDAAVDADWNAAVHRLVDALPEELRQPLALATVEELNSREIAQVMGIPEGTVRTRILRARQILRQKLAGRMEDRHERRGTD